MDHLENGELSYDVKGERLVFRDLLISCEWGFIPHGTR